MERLGRDVLAVLDALDIRRINWCGLSMGGMVGQWLGANAPERIERLVLTNTSSHFADKRAWNDRLKLVREKGIAAFAAPNMERWFTKQFRERAPETVTWLREMFAATPLDGYLACGEAVRDMDHRDLLPKIKAPTLVVAGKYDPATPPEANEYIKNHIPGARYTVLEAAHISNVEQQIEASVANSIIAALRPIPTHPASLAGYPASQVIDSGEECPQDRGCVCLVISGH
jgi:3-oxoadipate enol-lactonase